LCTGGYSVVARFSLRTSSSDDLPRTLSPPTHRTTQSRANSRRSEAFSAEERRGWSPIGLQPRSLATIDRSVVRIVEELGVDRLTSLGDRQGRTGDPAGDRVDALPVAIRASGNLAVDDRLRREADGEVERAASVVVGVPQISRAAGRFGHRVLTRRGVAALV